jgi:hypothetical protein
MTKARNFATRDGSREAASDATQMSKPKNRKSKLEANTKFAIGQARGCIEDQPQHVAGISYAFAGLRQRPFQVAAAGLRHSRAPWKPVAIHCLIWHREEQTC